MLGRKTLPFFPSRFFGRPNNYTDRRQINRSKRKNVILHIQVSAEIRYSEVPKAGTFYTFRTKKQPISEELTRARGLGLGSPISGEAPRAVHTAFWALNFPSLVISGVGKMLGFEDNGQERILETSLVQKGGFIKAQGQAPGAGRVAPGS